MDISSLQRRVNVAEVPLERMAGNTQIPEQEKVAEICRQFESVLLRQILSEAQKPHYGIKKEGPSCTSDLYRDMITNQMAEGISRSGGFGLANSLKTQLGREIIHVADDTVEPQSPSVHRSEL